MIINTPPPTGGINARDHLGKMAPNDAIQLVNWLPDGEIVRSRGGSATVLAQDIATVESSSYFDEYADIVETDLSGDIETLVEYDSGATTVPTVTADNPTPSIQKNNQLIACAGTKIWKYDTVTPVQLGLGFTSSRWQTVHFKNKLIFVNSVDAPQQYDGTTLSALTISALNDSGGTPTGDSATDLWGANVFKGRVFYWIKDAQYFYYADAGSYQGILTQFDLSGQLKHGGYLTSIQTYARDSGSGLDDYIVFFFSTGETLVYQGDDPSSSSSWSLVNAYHLAPPIDIRGFQQLGGDVIFLTLDGWQNLSAALPNQRLSNANQIGEKIINMAKRDAKNHGLKFGWDVIYYPKGSLLIVNVPKNQVTSNQHVQNTKTGAWTKFKGWNAKCFCLFNDDLYFADEFGNIRKADHGVSDNGSSILYKCRPAYQNFGSEAFRKQVNGVQVITNYRYPKFIHLDVNKDYNNNAGTAFTYPPEVPGFDWDVSFWDSDYWSDGTSSELDNTVRPPYKCVFGQGYTISILMRMASRTQSVYWYSTNINLKKMGGK